MVKAAVYLQLHFQMSTYWMCTLAYAALMVCTTYTSFCRMREVVMLEYYWESIASAEEAFEKTRKCHCYVKGDKVRFIPSILQGMWLFVYNNYKSNFDLKSPYSLYMKMQK